MNYAQFVAAKQAASPPTGIVVDELPGIGSEGYVSLQLSRRFIGVELKASYFRQASLNLANALRESGDLFAAA